MKKIIAILSILFIVGCSRASSFEFKPGFYGINHPKEKALWDALEKSSVSVNLSGHTGISLPAENGKGWENNISMERLETRLGKIQNRQQATILEEKNFAANDPLDKKVISLLKNLGFKTIIVQLAHSEGTIIEKVHTS